jgi:glycerol-3-phosphate dehydrogenase
VIRTRTRCIRAERGEDWRLVLEVRGRRDLATARVLVNATGPWVKLFAEGVLHEEGPVPARLDKGSHIVVPRLFEHDRGYLVQAPDRRVVFALPFERDFTLIGTTDQGFAGDPAAVAPSAAEIAYLCDVANQHFRAAVGPADVVWSFAGVRSLHDDGAGKAQDVSRDYSLILDERGAPLLTVYGGKITTYRRLAEVALDKLAEHLPATRGNNWTAKVPLPGGDFPCQGYEELVAAILRERPWLDRALAARLVRAYGTRARTLLGDAHSMSEMGLDFGAGLTEREVAFLMREEWATTADDVLWRRSKLGLRFSDDQKRALETFMGSKAAVVSAPPGRAERIA